MFLYVSEVPNQFPKEGAPSPPPPGPNDVENAIRNTLGRVWGGGQWCISNRIRWLKMVNNHSLQYSTVHHHPSHSSCNPV